MAVKIDVIRIGRVFDFKGGPRRVVKLHPPVGSGFGVVWEYADGIKRGGRLGGEQWVHYFRRAARAEIPDAWRRPTITLSGTDRTVPVFPEAKDVVIRTHCPAKWAFIDRETGDVWGHNGDDFRRMTAVELRELADLMEKKVELAREDQLQFDLP